MFYKTGIIFLIAFPDFETAVFWILEDKFNKLKTTHFLHVTTKMKVSFRAAKIDYLLMNLSFYLLNVVSL